MPPVTWDVMSGWGDGWTRSRQVPPAERVGDLWRIETGTEKESVRWLVPRPTSAVVEELLARDHPFNSAVKVYGDPAAWRASFPPGWEEDIPVWLMVRTLTRRERPALPGGYALEVDAADDLVVARVLGPDGELAARGRIGLGERHAVPDQVVTQPEHQRRGLGSLVMAVLEDAAAAHGLDRGVLGATAQGRALYRALGWEVAGPRLGMYWRPGTAA